MLVTSSQSSSQRPLGLSVEEIYALDRQYRRLDQQQQTTHTTNASMAHPPTTSSRLASSNLNRLTSRSLDLISSSSPSSSAPLTTLPSLEIHGHGYHARPQTPATSAVLSNYPRSNSIDQLRYAPAVLPNHIFPSTMKTTYPQPPSSRPTYENPRYRNYLQNQSSMASPPPMISATNSNNSSSYANHYLNYTTEPYDARTSCKLRRQQPIKRESSRRILVRPVIQRRREPSISSSCESLDETRPNQSLAPLSIPTFAPPPSSVTFTPSASLINHVIEPLENEQRLLRSSSNPDSLSDDSDINLYEMRVPIGKTYDTSDISVQLEGPKILIHCHTIEPTDKRGNYRKHEFKTELLVPDVVDDETIVSYLTEDGLLIVEGKYHSWAWKEIKQKRKLEQQQQQQSDDFQSAQSQATPSISSNDIDPSLRTESGFDQERRSSIVAMNHHQRSPAQIEKLDNNRTVIHVGHNSSSFLTDTKSVSDIINRFNTLTSTIWDGQYSFTSDYPPVLLYHVRLPLDASMDTIRIQADPQAQLLKVFSDDQFSSSNHRLHVRSTPRICRLPRDYIYDYAHLRVIFLRDNFIRIEVPTLH